MASRNAPKTIASALKRATILELRVEGLTLDEIGRDPRVKLTKSNVKIHLDRALLELAEHQSKQGQRLKALAYARLEKMLAKAMAMAVGGDLKAMQEAVRMINAQARVMGFDAPIKHASTDPSGEVERPVGHWTLPARPGIGLTDWQAEAQAILELQRAREIAQAGE